MQLEATHQKENHLSPLASFIFPDFRALFNIGFNLYSNINYKEVDINGFEIYIVEQWAAQRKISTLITSYTGNLQDTISAVEVALPEDPEEWPCCLKKYHEELLKFSSPKKTAKGTLFVTNLSSFKSTLNLLHVECGNLKKIWKNFKTNYDLKRLHCGGRSAQLLKKTPSASIAKFAQLYKFPNSAFSHEITSDFQQPSLQNDNSSISSIENIPVNHCPVVELTILVQISLSYFALFEYKKERDGLLCNGTKQSLEKWWEIYGKRYHGIDKPKNETILGPTTVASLLSLVLTCYFKLMVEDCMSAKDPFDEEEFYSGLYAFQKKYGLSKNNKQTSLDELTIDKLFEVSSKTSNKDIFKFKKVVKSTVQDMTGKGNFMHLSNEILTTDLDTLVKNIHGGSLGKLWKGRSASRKETCMVWERKTFLSFKFERGDPSLQLENNELFYGTSVPSEQLTTSNKEDSDTQPTKRNSIYDIANGSKSSLSISSMFCNYDETRYKSINNLNRAYRGEYFRRNSIPFCNDGIHDTKKISADLNKIDGLYRCNSYSEVQNAIELWSLPFDSSVIRLARDLLKIQSLMSVQRQLDEIRDGYLGKNSQRSYQNDLMFRQSLNKLQEMCERCKRGSNEFHWEYGNMQNKQQILESEKKDMRSLSSKLKYNVRILDRRVRDVEASVDHFDRKLEDVRKKLLEQNNSKDISMALESPCDKFEFDSFMDSIVQSQQTKYEGLCFKILDKKSLRKLKKEFWKWSTWTFDTFLYKNRPNKEKDTL
ncbi:CDA_G0032590.mRNA.1.CDS.1 [Saccharomyces cerevisiae]|nr:CDA_G0032590.mRNA.1.CDS.1 [Saccharomyces cerevisiae]CAI7383558.1 CDA_G0032590.mRNA.1.CDS.1 [Saccharomyces cerevisiae]